MVKLLQFSRLPLIWFGPGKVAMLPELVKIHGRKVLIATGKNSFTGSDKYSVLADSFVREGIEFHHVVIPGEPSPGMIDAITGKYRDKSVNIVVAIGGGSVMDAGKAISAMMTMNEPVMTFLEGVGEKDHPGTKLPFIAVPTTSGTGSEATKNAVISQVGKDGFKKSLRHDNFVPDIALVDPELTVNCPPEITAASGMDCFTQLAESFLSDRSNEYTDALAWEGLKGIKTSLVQCYLHGEDVEARSQMSFAALSSGICLANAGLGVVHGFASSVGGLYNIPHGVVCGTLMAPANAVTVSNLRKTGNNPSALVKYARLGRLFLGDGNKPDDYYIDGFVDYLQKLTEDLQLPALNKYGVEEKDAGEISAITEIKNNPAKLDREELIEIITRRI